MSPEEQEEEIQKEVPRTGYFLSSYAEFPSCVEHPSEIVLRRRKDPEKEAITFTHELGHAEFPVMYFEGPVGDELFSELCASYYSLKFHKDKRIRNEIRRLKLWALESGDISIDRLRELDWWARKRVGYKGSSVGLVGPITDLSSLKGSAQEEWDRVG